MTYTCLDVRHAGSTATVWLDRAARRNALDEALIAELTTALHALQHDTATRVIVLAGRGPCFCAGADLDWMRRAAAFDPAQNLADARALAGLLQALARSAKPVIARVHGAAMAGGTGLVAACDIAVATATARFGLSEVRLGLIPATISPYLAEAIGLRALRRYALTAEPISAETACRLGLVHELVDDEAALDARVAVLADQLALGAPGALAACKTLLRQVAAHSTDDDAFLAGTATLIAHTRAGAEAREGIAAFFDKRPPAWQSEPTPC